MKLHWTEYDHSDIKEEYRHLMPKTYECVNQFTWVDDYGITRHITHMLAEMDKSNNGIKNLYVDFLEDDTRGIDMCKWYPSLDAIEEEFTKFKEVNG